MNKLEIVLAAKELINSKDKWCQGHGAKDARGKSVYITSKEAQSFCLMGAVYRAAMNGERAAEAINHVESLALYKINCMGYMADYVSSWNDRPATKHEDVIAVLDSVAEDLEKEENANR